ncbi:hypothetical protein NSS71_08050 [Niallia sp. FSL W8-0951]|uniref:hypothetical protein n=1 Tax=Niallia sp. FSL W8-0951 TaxID=2954639 RepID=UPI0030FC6A9D
MTNYLTTGQMIDLLEIGRIGECVNAPVANKKKKQVIIDGLDSNLKYRDGYEFKFTPFMRKEAKWIILPKYVSLEEAIEYLRDGGVVTMYIRNIEHSFSKENYFTSFVEKGISIDDFLVAKWSI